MKSDGGADRASPAAYDRELGPWLFEPWVEDFLTAVEPPRGSVFADVACGTGLIVRHVLERVGPAATVHGVDIDEAMLDHAATTVTDRRVQWHMASAEALPLAAGTVDRVLCNHGLQFFDEPVAVLREFRRVLRPTGRLGISVWGRLVDNPWPDALVAAASDVLGASEGAAFSAVSRLGDPAELEPILVEAGLGIVRLEALTRTAVHPDAVRAVTAQIDALPFGSDRDEQASDRRVALIERMTTHLAPWIDENGSLAVPSSCLQAICAPGSAGDAA